MNVNNVDCELLVTGYIREIEGQLDNDRIIPDSITIICFEFYFNTKLVLLLNDRSSHNICLTDFHHKTKWIYNIQHKDAQDFYHTDIPTYFVPNMTVPDFMSNSKHNQHHVLFTSEMGQCNAILLAPNTQKTAKQADLTAIEYELPKLPVGVEDNGLSYSEYHHSLISVGGFDHGFSHNVNMLSFKDITINESDWKWTDIKQMTHYRAGPAAIMLSNHDLFVCGGFTKNETEIYNFEKDEWTEVAAMHNGRYQPGICNNDSLVYVAGRGETFSTSEELSMEIECYDIHKNQWNVLKFENMNCNKGRPIMWMEDDNLLYIGSNTNYIECIDIRQPNKPTDVVLNVMKIFPELYTNDTQPQIKMLI